MPPLVRLALAMFAFVLMGVATGSWLSASHALAARPACERVAPYVDGARAQLTVEAIARAFAGDSDELRGWGLGTTAKLTLIENQRTRQAPASLLVRFPKGAINPGHLTAPRGGLGLRWTPTTLRTADRACVSYRLRVADDFPFQKGGKLPGLIGGSAPMGGRRATGETGFSLRLMWRRGGRGEIYAYIPGHPTGRGLSLARGAFQITRGKDVQVSQEVVLNQVGSADGIIRLWIDGNLVIELTDVIIREHGSVRVDGVAVESFFGGKSASWAAPHATWLQLANMTVASPR